jgi:flavin-dependent dehydrogenase
MAIDVVIVGAGPSGAVAATVLARAGVRVRLIDRARFPRPKLCGDTLNPGAMADLRRLNLAEVAERHGLPLQGMRVTGEGGVTIDGAYPSGLTGRSLERSVFDAALVDAAVAAGVTFTDGVRASAPIVGGDHHDKEVRGVELTSGGNRERVHAALTIAADGRHSTLAFALGLARHPIRPRRWAIGVYAANVSGMTACGEMHIRRGRYIGVAPLPDGRANICLVKPLWSVARSLGDPADTLRRELARDEWLRERTAAARFCGSPTVLGPLAVNVEAPRHVPRGLILSGDAAGFVDPMTGDGLRFAIRGGELAAHAALTALTKGWPAAYAELARSRQDEFSAKERFNRVLRALVASPAAVRVASVGARLAPSIVRRVMTHASDCRVATSAS